MRCAGCDGENPDAARFCATCGTPLTAACAACAAELIPGARFCSACGTPVADAVSPPVEQDPRAGVAERRRVSVLFVDLVNFTSLSESMDPEDVRRVQSRYFEVARTIVAMYGGTIEKFIGDAVMAVWGAPAAHEDDAERAVRAALAMVYAVDRITGTVGGERLRARAAVTTGEAAVTIGAAGQGMVAGDLVNVAARLQNRAPPGGVLVDATTRERGAAAATFASAGSLSLKGRSGRLTAYRAVEEAPGPMSRQGGAHSGPFVGRERELRDLIDLLMGTFRDGRSRLVSVTGIAGIGKSRLTWELGEWIDQRDEDVAWHVGRAAAYGEGVAFAAVAEMVRRRIRVAEGAAPELVDRQLSTALEELVPDASARAWIEPRVAALLGRTQVAAFDREELFAAWRQFFERIADRLPVVLVFEDLQWADPGLIGFIEHLATWARSRPILIIALARPEFLDAHQAWGAGFGSFHAMHLERLDDAAMRRLLEALAPDLAPTLAGRILDRAGGVPLYAVEMARMLGRPGDGDTPERRRTVRERPDREAVTEVPDTLHGVIAARIDSLPAGERRLLLEAAVLGHRFPPEALVSVSELEPGTARGRIDGLLRHEMLSLDQDPLSPGRGELEFVQDLVREVAYETLSHAERRTIHLSAARYLESLDDHAAEALAGHLVEAHRLTKDPHELQRLARRAVASLRHAAQNATRLHVPERAIGLLEQALRLTDGADGRAPLLEEAAKAAQAAGRMEVAERHLRELLTIQVAKRQRDAASRTRARLASVLLTAQRNEPAMAELEAAMRSARGWQRHAAGVELAAQLARARLLLGDDAEAIGWADRALEAASALDLGPVSIDLLITRGTGRLSSGDGEAGSADLRDAIALAQASGSLQAELRARNNLAWSLLDDDPRAAMTIAREGFELATTMGVWDAAVPLADIACTAAIETGDWDWAMATLSELEERGVSDAYRIVFDATAATIRALRGDDAPLAALEGEAAPEPDTDDQVRAAVSQAAAWASLTSGDLEAARRHAEAAIAGYVGNDPACQRAMATRASLWLGDHGAARAALERLDAGLRPGRAAEAASLTLHAGLAALQGEPAAAETYDRAVAAWRGLELPLQRALCLLDRHRLLPDGGPEELARVLDELGAAGLRRLIGAPVSPRAGASQPAGSRRPKPRTGTRSGGARRPPPAKDPPSPAD